jgi:hypothetical protein
MTRAPFFALLAAALFLLAPGAGPAKKPDTPAAVADIPDLALPPQFDTGAGERIISYVSDVSVNRDASLDVTETIRVMAEGRDINHGIYRDFPTRYERNGRRVRVDFDVTSVERDGRPEPYTPERIRNGVRVKIGSADVNVTPGEHTYVLRYRTTRQVGFFPAHDELYWNVTGNDWMFPIDSAEVRIRLPQPVQWGERSVYTGVQGATASDGRVVSESPAQIVFRTTAPLQAREGLTVGVAWPKGVITEPPPPSATAQWLSDYGPIPAALLALGGLCWFYFYAWKRAGRGPVAGTVVPLFEPPAGMSAAAIRYVRRMGYDNRAFAAAIVESGVRGKLRLEEGEKGWFSSATTTIHRTGDAGDMPPAERDMLGSLFGAGDAIEMDKANHATFSAAQKNLREGLEAAYLGKLFLTNKGWAWVGLILMLAAMLFVATFIGMVDPDAQLGEAVTPALGFLLLAGSIWAGKGSRLAVTGGSLWLAALSVLLGVCGGVFVLIAVALVINTGWLGAILALFSPLLALPLVLSAFSWMAAPTREGRTVMDQIAGFERYLSITEEDRLEFLHPPEKTPELFERFLPHAIALGVENRWAGKFASVLAAASADPSRQGSSMGWYAGSHNVWSNPGMFATAVGATLVSSTASASTAPGSSSGSGGGGSSGGGGGGGGGGGW